MKLFRSLLALAGAFALTATAHASVIFSNNYNSLGELDAPYASVGIDFVGAGQNAVLDFQLAGYRSLDGVNCCTDTFSLSLNGTTIFSGAFNMGGGGVNTVFTNTNGATWQTTTFGALGDPHNTSEITWAGGVTDVHLALTLLNGTNHLVFSYQGGGQGLADEAWGLNQVTVTAVPEAETYAMMLLGLGLVAAAKRRKQ